MACGVLVVALTAPAGAAEGPSPAMAEAPAPQVGDPAAVVEGLHEALLAAARAHPKDVAARARALGPAVRSAYDFAGMLRLIAGRTWVEAAPMARAEAVEAFAAYSGAIYASRFEGAGVVFNTEGVFQGPRGTRIVRSWLNAPKMEPVRLDYVMRRTGEDGAPAIQDVLVDGGISEVATRRSDFDKSLEEGGLERLSEVLAARTAEILAGKAAPRPVPVPAGQ